MQVPYQRLRKDFTNWDSLNTLHLANIARTYSYDLRIWCSCENVHSMLMTLIMRDAFKLCAHCLQGYTVVTDIINHPISKIFLKNSCGGGR